MKIALIGYGKMGQGIEKVALERGHTITLTIHQDNTGDLANLNNFNSDVVIEFTHPTAVIHHLKMMIDKKLPIVVGTTGWHERLEEVKDWIDEKNGSLVYASNFSIGVNIMFKINQMLAKMMNAYPQYDVYVEERHHRHKADAPGGTALKLALNVLDKLERKNKIVTAAELLHRPPAEDEISLGITRAGEIKGEHRVVYTSPIDKLEISHEAYSREGFALGAVIAAEWIVNRKGVYEFQDIF